MSVNWMRMKSTTKSMNANVQRPPSLNLDLIPYSVMSAMCAIIRDELF